MLRAAVHAVFDMQDQPHVMAIQLEKRRVGMLRGVHDSLDLAGAEIPGESFVAWRGRPHPCDTSTAGLCRSSSRLRVAVTLGRPILRGDSAIVHVDVTSTGVGAARGRGRMSFASYISRELVLVPDAAGWRVARHRVVARGGS